MLAGKGFKQVINLAGGIKLWNSEKAVGREQLGLNLFSGNESPLETLVIAYSLEAGLQDFYSKMAAKVNNGATRQLFAKLAAMEVKHQERILTEYNMLSGSEFSRDEFSRNKVAPSMEGGITTEEYLEIYKPDIEVAQEVISLAMAIEAQALDLYLRAAEKTDTDDSKKVLQQIADEEHAHLEQLGKLFETI